MKKLKLNTKKIKQELKRLGKTQSWLAREMDMSRQGVNYILTQRPITMAVRVANALNLDPKDLII